VTASPTLKRTTSSERSGMWTDVLCSTTHLDIALPVNEVALLGPLVLVEFDLCSLSGREIVDGCHDADVPKVPS
jgi:hypothetical protein